MLSPCLFNLCAEYIMRNAGLEEVQAGIKIAGRNINNLSYRDHTPPMAESKVELKSLLMNMKEESKKLVSQEANQGAGISNSLRIFHSLLQST